MSDPRTLARLEQLRRRARDDARHRLAEARAALPRWLEACRTRERALAREAERLAAAVAAAERAYRTARLQLEQIEALRARTRETARREALRRDQRRLDDLKPMSGR
jgi:flagellar biosynthesis chaperone FliJ